LPLIFLNVQSLGRCQVGPFSESPRIQSSSLTSLHSVCGHKLCLLYTLKTLFCQDFCHCKIRIPFFWFLITSSSRLPLTISLRQPRLFPLLSHKIFSSIITALSQTAPIFGIYYSKCLISVPKSSVVSSVFQQITRILNYHPVISTQIMYIRNPATESSTHVQLSDDCGDVFQPGA
jgi:hypothetical protein